MHIYRGVHNAAVISAMQFIHGCRLNLIPWPTPSFSHSGVGKLVADLSWRSKILMWYLGRSSSITSHSVDQIWIWISQRCYEWSQMNGPSLSEWIHNNVLKLLLLQVWLLQIEIFRRTCQISVMFLIKWDFAKLLCYSSLQFRRKYKILRLAEGFLW